MKFSYSLLSALVPRTPAKAKLAELISRHTFEVEEISGNTIDLKLAANRYADAASHWGVAREIAAICKVPLHLPAVKVPAVPTDEGTIEAKVSARGACSHYGIRSFDVAKFARRTPPQIIRVLREAGLQPISPVVDVMNYVMLETGQPLHAFDQDKLSGGTLTVRWGKLGEVLEGLDGNEYGVAPDILVIADRRGPQAIAGIRGAAGSGVSSSTKRIVVEAATFSGSAVGSASRKLKLITDASVRFSHELSPALADVGMARVTQLLVELGAVPTDSSDFYPKPVRDLALPFSLDAYASLIGVDVSEREATRILTALGFAVKRAGERVLSVTVPATRTDVATQEDLAEEVARVTGYENLPATPLPVFASPTHDDHSVLARDRAIDFAVSAGFDEVRTSSFLAPADWASLAPYPGLVTGDLVTVANPISEERTHLRPSLLPHLIAAAGDALRTSGSARLAEVGTVDANSRGKLDERQVLGMVVATPGDEGALEVKGAIEKLLELHEVAGHWHQDGAVLSFVSGGSTVALLTVAESGRTLVGAGEVDLAACLIAGVPQFEDLPRFPSVTRDVAFLAPRATPAGDVIAAAEDAGIAELASVDLLERYRGSELPQGTQSLTLRLVFRAPDSTLTDAQVDVAVAKIASAVTAASGAKLR